VGSVNSHNENESQAGTEGLGQEELEARRIVRRAALSSALVGASPIPLGGIAGVPALQAKMLVDLAKFFGRPMEMREARDLVGFLGGATAIQYVCRLLTRTAACRLPAIGPAVGAASAFGSTFGLGLVAIRHLRPGLGTPGLGPDDFSRAADPAGFEREARALRLEWESGAISEETYQQDVEALRDKFLSAEDASDDKGSPQDAPSE